MCLCAIVSPTNFPLSYLSFYPMVCAKIKPLTHHMVVGKNPWVGFRNPFKGFRQEKQAEKSHDINYGANFSSGLCD